MKQIQLTQGQVALVDDADFEWLNQWKWGARYDPTTGTYYAIRGSRKEGKTKEVKMARLILGLIDPKIKGDHKDGNTLNNQRYNLRAVTASQSAINRKKFKNNTSGHKGVSWKEANKKWQVQINGKYGGVFVSLEEAVEVYEKKALVLHGEFARGK